ncbi:MAG: 2-amino-5-formylamino-6-ribosylaminopyrimidin-4(3H)-one 5'-monophosphate deformylase [Candidatus Hadarchaeales archaeon]
MGVLALGSHQERHGAVLPPDTDAKLAAHVALEAAKRSGAKFLGVLLTSYELPLIETGRHHPLGKVVGELCRRLKEAREVLGVRAAVLVNAHGGNKPLRDRLPRLEKRLGMKLAFSTLLVDLEGPHAGTGEVSAAAAAGLADLSRLREHVDPERHPEVGFAGLEKARRRYEWAERHAREVLEGGVRADLRLGKRMLERAVEEAVGEVRRLASALGP